MILSIRWCVTAKHAWKTKACAKRLIQAFFVDTRSLSKILLKCHGANLNPIGEKMFERIKIDPEVLHGQACIKGTRIPVHQIVRMLANSDTVEDLLEEYPSINKEDILACLDYAASLAEEQITPLEFLPKAT
jgi:uncharacterized protein (DUF433 family)